MLLKRLMLRGFIFKKLILRRKNTTPSFTLSEAEGLESPAWFLLNYG